LFLAETTAAETSSYMDFSCPYSGKTRVGTK